MLIYLETRFVSIDCQKFVSSTEGYKMGGTTSDTGIGPHEGIEFRLYREGKKDIILFFSDNDVDIARCKADLLDLGEITCILDDNLIAFIFYRPTCIDKAKRLEQLLAKQVKRSSPLYRQTECEIGAILGYERWQVDAYLNQ